MSVFIDVILGLAFIYLLVSLFASVINEWLTQLLKWRAKALEKAIGSFLKSPPPLAAGGTKEEGEIPLLQKFYCHPVIRALREERPGDETVPFENTKKPSYIPARIFAVAAFDVLFPEGELEAKTGKDLARTIEEAGLPENIRKVLMAYVKSGSDNIEKLRTNIETWFDDTMDRLSGWFNRKARFVTLLLGLAAAVALNIDTISVTKTLWLEPTVRANVVSYVEQNADWFDPSGGENVPDVNEIRGALEPMGLPIGWSDDTPGMAMDKARKCGESADGACFFWWLMHVSGWFLTAFAVSLGAQFWFDTLKRLMSFRSAGKVPALAKVGDQQKN